MAFTPAEFRDEFPKIDAIFSWYKAKILYAESRLYTDIYNPEDPGNVIMTVYIQCDEAVENNLDTYLRRHEIGGMKDTSCKWMIMDVKSRLLSGFS